MTLRGTSPDPKLLEIKITDKKYLEWLLKCHVQEVQNLTRLIARCPDGPKNTRRQDRVKLLRQRCIPHVAKLIAGLAVPLRPMCQYGHNEPAFKDGTCPFCLIIGPRSPQSQA